MSKKKEPAVEQLDTDLLIPYINNARTHPEEQITQIASSIKEFGFNQPILIDADNGVIAGHGRLLAAKKLELDKVPCIRLEHLTEAQKKAYILADNRIAMNSSWDFELLKMEVEDIQDKFYLKDFGFNREELEGLLGEFEHDIDVIDEINESVNFIVKCDNIAQKEIIKSRLGITSEKIQFETFIGILDGINSNN
jgi:ParB-like chromosome segregation protein Spo0J